MSEKKQWWTPNESRQTANKSQKEIKTLEDLPKLYTALDVAAYFGVKVMTVYEWKHKGLIQSVKLGRQLRFTAEQVQDFKNFRELKAYA